VKTKFFILLLTPLLGFGEPLSVDSEIAHYDGQCITLKGDVIIEHAMGTLCAQSALLQKDVNKTTSIEFPWITLKEHVHLQLKEGGALSCTTLQLDHLKMTSVLTGDPQVVYTDTLGEIYADHAHIDYIKENGSLTATKITLLDNVRLINGSTSALADRVFYDPQEQLVILEGDANRVLFYDAEKQMQLSAKTVHAKKNSIQGFGDVRFIFGPDELEKIKTQFHIQ